MGLLERLGGRKSVDLRPQEEILQKSAEDNNSRIKSAFEEKVQNKKVETFTGY